MIIVYSNKQVKGWDRLFEKEDDLILVENILSGNIKDFERLVERYETTILKFIYSMIRDKQIAEDITQEVFITVYNKLDTFDSKYKFSNWILRISKNKCIDYIRKAKKVNESNIDEFISIKSTEVSPEERLEFKETKQIIIQYINTLNDIDKQIIMLRYSQKATFNDISKILDINESSVKRRYYKIREQFKKRIAIEEKGCGYEL
ncbi:sigma-70 family RNA polymerase sigma factor [Clostridium bovifaecis]|uniref:Sigma-70 family RNA polymerase sigma factor n=1 Tax=Clostridium bovifaecis TaxID=2184719 RepID=A0A6I6ERR7_9CLOT|nr:sigma-70 family RNA polymerase sigma factor [Clostridium bovifaecis]